MRASWVMWSYPHPGAGRPSFRRSAAPVAVWADLASNQFLASLTLSNFNAMAMEPLGAIAGTASSFIGFYTTLVGALLGFTVGQAFDGTVMPLGVGYLCFSVLAVLVVLWTEKGRLFQPHNKDPS